METKHLTGAGQQRSLGLSAKAKQDFSLLEICRRVEDPTSRQHGRPDRAQHSFEILAAAADLHPPRNGEFSLPSDLVGHGRGGYIAGSSAGAQITDPSAGGFLVDERGPGQHVDALVAHNKILQLADRLDNVRPGDLRVTKSLDAGVATWLDEDEEAVDIPQPVGLLTASPRTVAASFYVSRSFIKHSVPGSEQRLQRNLLRSLALTAEQGFLTGAGGRIFPIGLLEWPGIVERPGGTDGLVPAFDHMVKLETALRGADVDTKRCTYLVNAITAGTLKRTPQHSTANVGGWIWQPFPGQVDPSIGMVNGYPAHVSNHVPSDLVKGGSGAVCSPIMFVDWSRVLIVSWGSIEIRVDPFSNSKKGGVQLTAFWDVDMLVLDPAAVAVMPDALPLS